MTEPTIDDLRNLKDGDLYTNDATVRRALINLLEDWGGGSDPSDGVQNPLTEDLAAGGYTITGLPVYANVGAAPSTGVAASVGTVDNIAQAAASSAVSSANSYTDSALPGAISSAVSQANSYTDNQLPDAISSAVSQANSYTDSVLPGAISDAVDQANNYTDSALPDAISSAVSQANTYTDNQKAGTISDAVSQANAYTDNQLPDAISSAVSQANSYTDSELPGAISDAVSQANSYTDNQIGALQLPTSGTSDLTFDSGAGSNADSASGTVYWTRIGDIVTLHAEIEVTATDEGPVNAVMTLSGSAPTPPGTHFGSGAVADTTSVVTPVLVGASGASFEIDFEATGGGVFEGAFTLTFQV